MIFLNFLVSYIYAINQTSTLVFLDTLIRSIQQVVSSTTRVSCLHLVYPARPILRRCEPSSRSGKTLNTSPQKVLHPSRRSGLFPDLTGGRDAHSAAGPVRTSLRKPGQKYKEFQRTKSSCVQPVRFDRNDHVLLLLAGLV